MLQTHDVLRGWHRGYRNRLNVSLFWFLLLLELFPFWKLLPLCAVHLHLRLLFRCLQRKWYFSMISCEIYVYFLFFHLSLYIVRARVRNKPRAFLHFSCRKTAFKERHVRLHWVAHFSSHKVLLSLLFFLSFFISP